MRSDYGAYLASLFHHVSKVGYLTPAEYLKTWNEVGVQ